MPKLVDRDLRRLQLAEVVWRVIRRDGVEGASVRQVAAEAGISMGSLRHYFATQSELLAFAMTLVSDRARARIEALDLTGQPREVAERVLVELLPLDRERLAETEVWLAFTGRALVDSELRAVRDENDALLRSVCRNMVAAIGVGEPDREAEGPDLTLEAERLYAVLDGLALHAVIRPDRAPPAELRAVLARHLDELAEAAGA